MLVWLPVTATFSGGTAYSTELQIEQQNPQVVDTAQDSIENPYKAVFRAGFGAGMRPKFRGASGINFSPSGVFGLTYLRLPYTLNRTKSEAEITEGRQGFKLSPSFSFSSRRNSETSERLEGLKPINYVFELGILVGYRLQNYEGYIYSAVDLVDIKVFMEILD